MLKDDSRPSGRPLAYRVPVAAAELGISDRQLWRIIKRGELRVIREGHAILIPPASLEEWIRWKLGQGMGVANAEG